MAESSPQKSSNPPAKPVAEISHGGIAAGILEFVRFALANKRWWLAPILLVFLLLTAVVLVGATEAAPFIYTLF